MSDLRLFSPSGFTTKFSKFVGNNARQNKVPCIISIRNKASGVWLSSLERRPVTSEVAGFGPHIPPLHVQALLEGFSLPKSQHKRLEITSLIL